MSPQEAWRRFIHADARTHDAEDVNDDVTLSEANRKTPSRRPTLTATGAIHVYVGSVASHPGRQQREGSSRRLMQWTRAPG